MNEHLGFSAKETQAGELIISHHGKQVTILRGSRAGKAKAALDAATCDEQQLLLARLTGNYKRGNERAARNHPKNRR